MYLCCMLPRIAIAGSQVLVVVMWSPPVLRTVRSHLSLEKNGKIINFFHRQKVEMVCIPSIWHPQYWTTVESVHQTGDSKYKAKEQDRKQYWKSESKSHTHTKQKQKELIRQHWQFFQMQIVFLSCPLVLSFLSVSPESYMVVLRD